MFVQPTCTDPNFTGIKCYISPQLCECLHPSQNGGVCQNVESNHMAIIVIVHRMRTRPIANMISDPVDTNHVPIMVCLLFLYFL